MLKKAIFAILAIVCIATLLLPTRGWIYPDCSEDSLFERYGPRADQLQIHLGVSDFQLTSKQIDIYDPPLSKSVYNKLVFDYPNQVKVVSYGPEFGFCILDMNSNNNTYMGNPPDPVNGANPMVTPGVHGNWMADVWLRRAIAYLVDRPALIADPSIGAGFGYPVYTGIPPAQPKYIMDIYGNTTAPWAWQYDPAACNATLDAHGYTMGPSGNREYRGTVVDLTFYIPSWHAGRKSIGSTLVTELTKAGFKMNTSPPNQNVFYADSSTCHTKVLDGKNFHLYIGDRSLGVDPDMTMWDWNYYWHPGQCPNYCGHNDPEFNDAAERLKYANTQAEAVSYCYEAQWRQAYMVLSAPVYCAAGNKAYNKWNVGSHLWDGSENQDWLGTVNVQGYGVDNYWTLMNWHTNVTPCDNGMTIDYGFEESSFRLLNPIYTSVPSDWKMLNLVYDTLLMRNASNLNQFVNWMTKQFSVDMYNHPAYGPCTKVRITLRPDLYWSDGTPLTTADVYFTFVELNRILTIVRGFPKPWWWGNVQNILSLRILDPLNFEVLLDVKSYWALDWIGSQIILPKHIWKPIALTGNPQMNCTTSPATLIGSGPWKFVDYNKTTNLAQLGKNTLFHSYVPVITNFKNNGDYRIKFDKTSGLNPVVVTLENLNIRTPVTYNLTFTVKFPNGTVVNKISDVNIAFAPGTKITYTIPWTWVYGRHDEGYVLQVISEGQKYSETGKWVKYVTILEDIAGSTWYDDIGNSTYQYKTELPSPDTRVDIQDVARASAAFGSYPGHYKWNTVADVTGDYKIDIQDLARISKKFGWHAMICTTRNTTATTVHLGQTANFTATVSGGSLPYTYQWHYQNSTGSYLGGTLSTWAYKPTTTGTSNVWCVVTDINGGTTTMLTPNPGGINTNVVTVTTNP